MIESSARLKSAVPPAPELRCNKATCGSVIELCSQSYFVMIKMSITLRQLSLGDVLVVDDDSVFSIELDIIGSFDGSEVASFFGFVEVESGAICSGDDASRSTHLKSPKSYFDYKMNAFRS